MTVAPLVVLCSLEDAVAYADERLVRFGSTRVAIPADAWAAIRRLVALQAAVNEGDAHADRLRFEALVAEAEELAAEIAA